jgi:hypothetical protein
MPAFCALASPTQYLQLLIHCAAVLAQHRLRCTAVVALRQATHLSPGRAEVRRVSTARLGSISGIWTGNRFYAFHAALRSERLRR